MYMSISLYNSLKTVGSKKGIGYKISRFVLAFDRYQKYCHFAKRSKNKDIKKIKICI